MSPEPDVRSLASHLVYRFIENGVPLADYRQITESIDRWDDWCAAWTTLADLRSTQADEREHEGADRSAAELRLIAALEYHFGKFLFVHDMDQLRQTHLRAVASYKSAVGALPWPGQELRFTHNGGSFVGVLRTPSPAGGPHPTVVVVPGLDATKEEMHRLQDVFLARGMATFSFDGPGQGEAEYDTVLPADWENVGSAALDELCKRPEVEPDRLAMVGVSLGGYFAARTASVEPRLRAAASVGGCFGFGECWDRLAPLTRAAFRVRSGAADEDEARKLADDFTLATLPAETRVPFLVLHGGRDRLFGDEQAMRLHRHFGDDSELVVEPEGNHVLHNLAHLARPRVADWTAARLGLTNGVGIRG